MISDMIDAVKAKGLRVYLYTHPYQPLTGDLTIAQQLHQRAVCRVDGPLRLAH